LNVDLIVASSIFIIFISVTFFYLFGFQKQGPSWQSLIELRKEASDLANEIISKGNPSDWNKENVIPSKIGLASSAYLIPILISDNSGYNRINEPIAQEIVFDNDCKNLAWNGTVRIFDENFNEIPFRFVNQTFCPSGYLQKAILFFEVNVSANSTRKLQIFFYNSTQANPKDYGNFSSLVMWLTFDEGSGNIAHDYSGNGNNGALYNGSSICSNPPTPGCPTWVDGKFGKALSFDGTNDYISVPYSSSLYIPSELTLIAWVYPINPGGGWQTILAHSPAPNQYNYWIYIESNALKASVYSDTYPDIAIPNSISKANLWYHIVLTASNGSTVRLYVNGSLVGTGNAKTNFWTGGYITIGDLRPVRGMIFNGTIDDVRIYNRTLTDEEILSHYQQPLSVKVFPRMEVSLISFEKLEALRNISYDLLKDALQKGYNFRVEIYEK